MKTFYWHDYETWGTNPAIDHACQFAGVRTDEDFQIIGEPLVIYCQPAVDILPQPEACLVTGISPLTALREGYPEREFISQIQRQFSQPGTCGVGYNSIRFDDEVTRYTLYRNYFDPYEREWRNGNSRWDIIDMIRLCYALRPEGIEWPVVDGKPSFKLENLTAANGIAHTLAHDAYADVVATIQLAQLVKEKKSSLYHYVYNNRTKQQVNALIDIRSRKPLLHISSKFPSINGCAGLVAPLAIHPINRNAVIVFNLSVDPAPLATLTAEEIHKRVFTAQDDLPEGEDRIPLKLVHLNKCPVLATAKLLDTQSADRLGIDKERCELHWQKLLTMDLTDKLQALYKIDNFVGDSDPETRLYDGFIRDLDKPIMADLRQATAKELASETYVFNDARLNEMILRYKARNFPSSLSANEKAEWNEFVRQRLLEGGAGRLSSADYQSKLAALTQEHSADQVKMTILTELKAYGEELIKKFGI